jgi:hypothetical protein
MSLNEKVDVMIEKFNLDKLDFLIFTLTILLAILGLGIFTSWLFNPNTLQNTGFAGLTVQTMFLCLFVPLLAYSYGSLADRINIRVLVIRVSLIYALFTILTACFVDLLSLHAFLIGNLTHYQFLLTISEYLSFILFPIFGLVIILVTYSLLSRNLGHWLISQVPKKMELERISLDSLFRPLPAIGRSTIKILVGLAIVQLILIDALWAGGLRLEYHGLSSIPLLIGYGIFTIMAALFVLRSKTVYGYLFHATARHSKLRDDSSKPGRSRQSERL